MSALAYVNGTFGPIEQATVSVEDRGFQFADGVYEVVLFSGNQPLFLDGHMQRLVSSCETIGMHPQWSELNLEARIREGVERAGLAETMVYIQLTRGTAPRHHLYADDIQPTVVMTFRERPAVAPAKRENGIVVKTVPDERWARCHAKTIALLPNILAKNAAVAAGYDDALFLSDGGIVREAAAANVFVISDDRLWTPPLNHTILPGITRKWILDCARRIDLTVKEHAVTLPELLAAQEVFLCSTTIDVLSVVRVDDHTIGDGRPGPLAAQLHDEMIKDLERPDGPG